MLSPRLFAVLALVALWWPSRLSGVLDGPPFDSADDAVILGLVLPLLFVLAPSMWRQRAAPTAVVLLLAWKAFAYTTVVQDGWCTRVVPARPYVRDGTGAAKNWDLRTDWRSADPRCSAITTRPYLEDLEFPVWFFNLPSASGDAPAQDDVPPDAVTHLTMSGTFVARAGGTFSVEVSPSVHARLRVDGNPSSFEGVVLDAGSHDVQIEATLTRRAWLLAPLWNGADLFASTTATVAPLSPIDHVVRPWGRWVTAALAIILLLLASSHLVRLAGTWPPLAWAAGSAAAAAAVASFVPARQWHYATLLLLAAAAVKMPERLHTLRGAILLLAPAWLTFNVFDTYYDQGFGRMEFIMPGNDWWTFLRYAYRIYMQGYWLEGGEHAFWFQPFYRWIAGALHMLFGQSGNGENYWDAVGVLAMALFSFEVIRRVRGFRWGIGAAVLTLAVFIAGPGYVWIGRGLAEISSAALICSAALCVIRARDSRSIALLIGGGVLAVLGVWTRLNNLPMAVAITLFAWPLSEPAATLWKPKTWGVNLWLAPVIVVPAVIAFGMTLFALRTWYYTGHFSVFYGTQSAFLAVWQEGMSFSQAARAMIDSVWMIASTTDPPRYHNGALPIIAGLVLSILAVSGAGVFNRLPLPLVGFTLAAFSSALIARGSAYSGRFSIHVVAVTVAVVGCAVAAMTEVAYRYRPSRDAGLVKPWTGLGDGGAAG